MQSMRDTKHRSSKPARPENRSSARKSLHIEENLKGEKKSIKKVPLNSGDTEYQALLDNRSQKAKLVLPDKSHLLSDKQKSSKKQKVGHPEQSKSKETHRSTSKSKAQPLQDRHDRESLQFPDPPQTECHDMVITKQSEVWLNPKDVSRLNQEECDRNSAHVKKETVKVESKEEISPYHVDKNGSDDLAEDINDELYGSDFEEASSESSHVSVHKMELGGVHTETNRDEQYEDVSKPEPFVVCISENLQKYRPPEQAQTKQKNCLIDFTKSIDPSAPVDLTQRAKYLLRLVDLEFFGTDHLFELKPVDEYSIYMMRFGRGNHNQVYVQTSDDVLDVEVQTDPIFMCKGGKWTQFPELDCLNYIGSDTDAGDNFPYGEYVNSLLPSNPVENAIPRCLLGSMRTMLKLLEEEDIPDFAHFYHSEDKASNICEPDAPDEDIVDEFIRTRSGTCIACEFSRHRGERLLTIHQSTKRTTEFVEASAGSYPFYPACGETVFIWSITNGANEPEESLYCPGVYELNHHANNIVCATFSPDSFSNMVVGGLSDGSLCLWDLNDTPYESSKITEGSETRHSRILKPPIYSTSGIEIQCIFIGCDKTNYADEHGHSLPIIQVKPIKSNSDGREETDFQLAALDSSGLITVWMVIRSKSSRIQGIYSNLSGSQTDLGLRPATSTVQMIRLSQIAPKMNLTNLIGDVSLGMLRSQSDLEPLSLTRMCKLIHPMATTLAVTHENHFLIGFTDGNIIQQHRNQDQHNYTRKTYRASIHSSVCTIAVHSEKSLGLFLVGYTDGSLCLFQLGQCRALQEWHLSFNRTQLNAVIKAIWSLSHPALFFTLGSDGRITAWDLLDMDNRKIINPIANNGESGIEILDFSLSPGVHVKRNGEYIVASAFAFISSDSVKIHWLEPEMDDTSNEELTHLRKIVDDLLHTY